MSRIELIAANVATRDRKRVADFQGRLNGASSNGFRWVLWIGVRGRFLGGGARTFLEGWEVVLRGFGVIGEGA